MCSRTSTESSTERIATATETGRGDPLSVTILRAITEATGRDLTEGPPLQTYVDVDALRRLITKDRSDVEVSFQYEDVRVTVHSDGTISVLP